MNPITDIWRGNCVCGKWIVLPRGFTFSKPYRCHGPCGSNAGCGREWYWQKDDHGHWIVVDEARPAPVV